MRALIQENTINISAPAKQSTLNETPRDTSAKHSAASFDRRHDLDALRAIAMLLGIVLHAALSFTAIPWTVQDSQQSEIYHALFAFIHGFRMPLFFMLSGFFTAMLWRKRGLKSLISHRFKRIFLPLVLGCVTIIPAMWAVSYFVSRPLPETSQGSALFAAVVAGDTERVQAELQNPDIKVNEWDSSSGSSPLCTAVFMGHTQIVQLLVDADANVNQANRDQATPLHIAVFMGRAMEAEVLLEAGADPNAVDGSGQTPLDLLNTDFGSTNFIASSLGVPLEEEALLAGRQKIAERLGQTEYIGSDANAGGSPGLKGLLFQFPVFMHLWFLWFLCWLVVAFAFYTVLAKSLRIEKLPRWLLCSPISLLWLVPLTILPQTYMAPGTFGPDPSIGLLPIPAVLTYYAIFFFFGVMYWDTDDAQGQLGSQWHIILPVAMIIVFPIGFGWVTGTLGFLPRFEHDNANLLVGNFLQAMFAWLMVFGSIGFCRRLLSHESRTLRYVSDSSYWLYLAHLPIVLLAQWFVRDIQLPAFAKFAGITVLVSVVLLITYEYGVRYTLIGHLLNGPRKRTRAVQVAK